MPQNDFVPWATGAGANVYSTAGYIANPARQTGVVDGEADPLLANNSWRQGTVWASVLGQLLGSAGYDARDNGDLTTLLVNLQSTISSIAQSGAPGSTSLVHSGPDTSSTTNQITIPTVTPDVPSLQDYQVYEIVPAITNTGATSLTIKTFAALPLLRRSGGQLVAGDAAAGVPFLVVKLGSAFRMLSAAPSEIVSTTVQILNAKRIAGGTPYPYNTPGNYTLAVPANTTFNVGECRGGGGGGGGASSTNSAGGGGGGGANSTKVATTTVDTVLAITVGIGGSPGGAGANNGGSGGTTMVSIQSGSATDGKGNVYTAGQTLCAATGGGGGQGAANGSFASQFALGGLASGGDSNRPGDNGGLPLGSFTGGAYLGGLGGASPGSGGSPQANQGAIGNASSAAGVGGNGSSTNGSGGPGSPGSAVILM